MFSTVIISKFLTGRGFGLPVLWGPPGASDCSGRRLGRGGEGRCRIGHGGREGVELGNIGEASPVPVTESSMTTTLLAIVALQTTYLESSKC